jgi:ADP-ribose pyrophosphatase
MTPPHERKPAPPDLTETLIERRVVFAGRYLRAEERVVRLADGSLAQREVICPPDAAGVLPVDDARGVYLVRQYRTALERVTLEIPAGVIDAGEAADQTARRECQEEIGLRPERLTFLFSYYHSVGFSTGRIQIFLGQGLTPVEHRHSEPGERIEIVRMPFEELYRRALAGDIVDSKTLLAAFWYQQAKP